MIIIIFFLLLHFDLRIPISWCLFRRSACLGIVTVQYLLYFFIISVFILEFVRPFLVVLQTYHLSWDEIYISIFLIFSPSSSSLFSLLRLFSSSFLRFDFFLNVLWTYIVQLGRLFAPDPQLLADILQKNQASKAPMQVSSQQQLCQQKMIRGNMPKHSTLNSTNIYQISFSPISFITLQNGSSRMEWRRTNGNIRYPFYLNISNNVKYQNNEQKRNPPELKFYTNDYQVIKPYYHQIW